MQMDVPVKKKKKTKKKHQKKLMEIFLSSLLIVYFPIKQLQHCICWRFRYHWTVEETRTCP